MWNCMQHFFELHGMDASAISRLCTSAANLHSSDKSDAVLYNTGYSDTMLHTPNNSDAVPLLSETSDTLPSSADPTDAMLRSAQTSGNIHNHQQGLPQSHHLSPDIFR